ncbi:hypothetical protein TrVGV298_006695 [Trichoderma virens]|nr:hypothetical protein TrVGV298_006695 [Trichoderma virens]UKZ78748.1 hypothetical protein TrVFT333_006493 [Trichoderma virens FT-333]
MTETTDAVAIERSIQCFTHVHFNEKLAVLRQESEVFILLSHAGSDAGTPLEVSAGHVKQVVPRPTLKGYAKRSHILISTHMNNILTDILDFVGSI